MFWCSDWTLVARWCLSVAETDQTGQTCYKHKYSEPGLSMSQYKVLPSYTDLTSLPDIHNLPVIFSAGVGGVGPMDDTAFQVRNILSNIIQCRDLQKVIDRINTIMYTIYNIKNTYNIDISQILISTIKQILSFIML